MVSRPIKSLFKGIIDYAGLFPPAKLDMAPAVEEFAEQQKSRESWILARFIVPAARLQELEKAMDKHHGGEGVWPLSVLVGGDLEAAKDRIDAFDARNAHRARTESIEYKPVDEEDVARAKKIFDGCEIFYEISHQGDPTPMFRAVARAGERAKIRTGGVTEDLIPSSQEVARFIRAARMTGVPFKATAGLHHALRGDYRLTYEEDSPTGTMHGFLNVFLAAAFVHHGELPSELVEELLEEKAGGVFELSTVGAAWRGHRLSADELAEAREKFALSYGSCSFQEPVDELRGLYLL